MRSQSWKLERGGNLRRRSPMIEKHMPIRLKKLIGTVMLVLLVIVYALAATTIAAGRLAESGPIVHLLFFLISGLLWVLPAMAVIKWMVREPKPKA
jgi:hypothetical protein